MKQFADNAASIALYTVFTAAAFIVYLLVAPFIYLHDSLCQPRAEIWRD